MTTQVPARVRPDHIRSKIAQDLRDLGLALEDRVYANRALPYSQLALPACSVYLLTVEKELSQSAPRAYKRTGELVVELAGSVDNLANGREDLEQIEGGPGVELDLLADEIETHLEHDATLGGMVEQITHKRQVYDPPVDGDRKFGFLRLFLEVVWFTDDAGEQPLGGFPPLRTVQVEQVPNGSVENSTSDRVTLSPG